MCLVIVCSSQGDSKGVKGVPKQKGKVDFAVHLESFVHMICGCICYVRMISSQGKKDGKSGGKVSLWG